MLCVGVEGTEWDGRTFSWIMAGAGVGCVSGWEAIDALIVMLLSVVVVVGYVFMGAARGAVDSASESGCRYG